MVSDILTAAPPLARGMAVEHKHPVSSDFPAFQLATVVILFVPFTF